MVLVVAVFQLATNPHHCPPIASSRAVRAEAPPEGPHRRGCLGALHVGRPSATRHRGEGNRCKPWRREWGGGLQASTCGHSESQTTPGHLRSRPVTRDPLVPTDPNLPQLALEGVPSLLDREEVLNPSWPRVPFVKNANKVDMKDLKGILTFRGSNGMGTSAVVSATHAKNNTRKPTPWKYSSPRKQTRYRKHRLGKKREL